MLRAVGAALLASAVVGCNACSSSSGTAQPDSGAVDTSQTDVIADVAVDSLPTADSDSGSGWHPVSGGAACGLLEADLTSVHLPKRIWASCGNGCLATDAGIPGFGPPLRNQSSGAAVSGESYLQLENNPTAGPFEHLIEIFRISDGETLAAVRQTVFGSCSHAGAPAAPFTMGFIDGSTGASQILLGKATAEVHPVAWQEHWLPAKGASSLFDWGGGIGMTFSSSTVSVVTGLDAIDFAPIDSVRSYVALGREDLAMWSSQLSPTVGVIRGHTSAGVATYVSQDADTQEFALSDDKLVWIGTHGPSADTGTYESAELYWSPRPKQPSDVVVHVGPSLPWRHELYHLKTGGDYAATVGINDTGPRVLVVVQLSTSKQWTIRPRPGSQWVWVMAVSPFEIVVAEVDDPATGSVDLEIQRLIRLDVSKLDALAATW